MKRYPVIVHLHGGHFMYGASQLYPSHALASTGVLVVTLNYRLGAFGFLTTQGFASLGFSSCSLVSFCRVLRSHATRPVRLLDRVFVCSIHWLVLACCAHAAGNWGLWDQVEALKWVRDNIEWFRGDKTSVTSMNTVISSYST